jgi:hypothetical protein
MAKITLIPKPKEETENLGPRSLMNIDTNIFNKMSKLHPKVHQKDSAL